MSRLLVARGVDPAFPALSRRLQRRPTRWPMLSRRGPTLPTSSFIEVPGTNILLGASAGSVGSVVSVSRDMGSDAGGTTLVITVTALTGSPPVTFGSNAATGIQYNTPAANQITCVTPSLGTAAASTGTQVNVNVGSKSLANGFMYLPASVGILASHNFDDGTFGPFSSSSGAGSTIAVSNNVSFSAPDSARSTFGANFETARFTKLLGTTNYAAQATGLFGRVMMYIPLATAVATDSNGQIKQCGQRVFDNVGVPVAPGCWSIMGIGPELTQAPGSRAYCAIGDSGTGVGAIGANFIYTAATWYEVIFFCWRDTVNHLGYFKWWLGTGGSISFRGGASAAGMGVDSVPVGGDSEVTWGYYNQNLASWPQDMFHDNATVAQGCTV